MNNLLEEIFTTNEFKAGNGKIIKIHSHTRREQCSYLSSLIDSNKLKLSIEIGFAYGVSSLAIADAISKNGDHKHIIIDKFENASWGGVGIELLNKAGFENKYEFYEDYCYNVLPKLLTEGRKFDFAYIDSTKQFDWLLTNFFYLDKMLEAGGIIVFDDVAFPGIRKLARFISNFPSYKVHSAHPQNYPNKKLSIFSKMLGVLPFSKKLFRYEWLNTDFSKGINSNCIAFRKIANDNRNWDWYTDF